MKSVLTTFRVLEQLALAQPANVAQLSRDLDLPKSTTQRALHALAAAGWILHSDADGLTKWVLSERPLAVGKAVGSHLGLRAAAMAEMERLRSLTQETIHLTLPGDGGVVLVEKLDSFHPVRTFNEIGGVAPYHASSAGKSVLAHWSVESVTRRFSEGLERFTDQTLGSVDDLLEQLQQIRSLGYAVNNREWREEVVAVGCSVLSVDRRPIAALSISIPSSRAHSLDLEHLGSLVCESAASVSFRVSGQPPAPTGKQPR